MGDEIHESTESSAVTRVLDSLLTGRNYLQELDGYEWQLLLNIFANSFIPSDGEGIDKIKSHVPHIQIGFKPLGDGICNELIPDEVGKKYTLILNSTKIGEEADFMTFSVELIEEFIAQIPTKSGWEILQLTMRGATPRQRIDIMDKYSSAEQKKLAEYTRLVKKFEKEIEENKKENNSL